MHPYKITASIFLFLMCLGGTLSAQESDFNRFSLELSTGIHIPLSPLNEVSASEYIAFKQFQLAGRYMFSKKFGVKALYGFDRFDDPNESRIDFTLHRIGVDGVTNIGKLLKMDYNIQKTFGLLLHAGAGLTFAKSSIRENTDHMGTLDIGLTSLIKLNNRFSVFGDVTYLANLRQHTYFSGVTIPNGNYQTGSLVNMSVGIMYYLGSQKFHADWH